MSGNPIFTYWYFHLPNLALAALMYTAIGRVALSFVFDNDAPNYIWRFFRIVTDPVIRFVGYFTPRAVPQTFVLLFSIVWLFAARIVLFFVLTIMGLAPTAGVAQ